MSPGYYSRPRENNAYAKFGGGGSVGGGGGGEKKGGGGGVGGGNKVHCGRCARGE